VKPAGISRRRKKGIPERINELAIHGKIKNIRDLYSGINEFKKGYQSGSNLVRG
jgi:hypothetical protein